MALGCRPQTREAAWGIRAGGCCVEGTWEDTEIMRFTVGGAALMLCLTATSCSAQPGSPASESDGAPSSGDCSAQVRVAGVVYTSYGYSHRPATKHSVGEVADCDDLGPDGAGSVFSDRPRQVTTWSFREYSPEQVVGVRSDRDSFAVYVADAVPDVERDRIFRELAPPSP